MPNETNQFTTLNDFTRVLDETQATFGDKATKLVDALEDCVTRVQAVEQNKKKVIFIGNGGSAAISSHQSTDLWKNGNLRAMAFNDVSLLTCAANDYGWESVFVEPMKRFCDEGDLLIAISSSGNSVNILNGVKEARNQGVSGVIAFSGFKPDNSLRKLGDVNFYLNSMSYGIVEVGHELLIHAIVDEFIRRGK